MSGDLRPENSRVTLPRFWLARYGLALAVLGVGIGIRLVLDPWVVGTYPFLTVFPSVAVAVWYGGLGPGLVVAVLGYLSGSYLFGEPPGHLLPASTSQFIVLIGFGVASGVIVALGESMHRSRARAEHTAREVDQEHRQVLEEASHREEQDDAIRGKEARMRAFLETSLDGIITMNFEGRILEFNPAAERLFGFRSEEAVGRRVVDLIVPERLRTLHTAGLAHYLRTGEAPILDRRVEMPALRSDGSEFPVELSITRILTPGMPVFMGHVRDISERVEAERRQQAAAAELREADRKKTEFLATLSHELRNPLAPLRNALDLVRRERSEAGLGYALPIMERQLGQLVRLVDDLLDVSRITRSIPELRRTRIALAAAVRNAIETSRPLIEERGHQLTVSLPADSIWIDADLTRMAQVFSNLLNNAAKYTEPRGRISVVAERQGSDVLVRVRDTGVGIPAEHLTGIFDMFVQVDQSLHRTGGLGIGLTLVKRLVELHGGTIEARSAGLGKGSEFLVRLPMAAGPPEARSRGLAEPRSGPRRRILVVDDNRDATETLGLVLERMGHETRLALDGVAAVEAAAAFRPEVILLDIGLPKLSGYDVCQRIRSQPWGKDMVVIAITGWGQESDKARAMAAGFTMHLVKPVDLPELEKLLKALSPTA